VRIFGPKRDEVTREWRTVHNEEYHDLYSSPNIVRTIKSKIMLWTGHVARLRERRGKPGGKRPLGVPRHRWEDNIKMDLQEVGCGGMDSMELAEG
jgi:hypothetical protein